MLAYGVIQLGSTIVSAVALVAITLNSFSLKKQSNFFNECVEEMKATGSPIADSVRFCSGGYLIISKKSNIFLFKFFL